MTLPIRSNCGQFYAGMKSNEVGAFSRALFNKIDKNKDEVLQDNEICDYRDEEANILEIRGKFYSEDLLIGYYGIPSVSKNIAAKIREETEQYRKEHFNEQSND